MQECRNINEQEKHEDGPSENECMLKIDFGRNWPIAVNEAFNFQIEDLYN